MSGLLIGHACYMPRLLFRDSRVLTVDCHKLPPANVVIFTVISMASWQKKLKIVFINYTDELIGILTRHFKIAVVVVECIYSRVFSHSVATSSAECNRCNPPSSLVCGQLLTMCDVVWRLHKGTCRLLQGPTSFRDRIHNGLGWSGSDLEVLQWGLDRSNPGCRLVGSSNVDAAVGLNVDRRADGTRCPPLSDRQDFAFPWSGSISLSFCGGGEAQHSLSDRNVARGR